MSTVYTLETLGVALRSRGLRGPQKSPLGDGLLYWRAVETPNGCLSNDSLQFTVTVHEVSLPGHGEPFRSMSFDLTGEYRTGTWAKIEAYSVPWDRGVAELDQFQAELLRAWSALYSGAV